MTMTIPRASAAPVSRLFRSTRTREIVTAELDAARAYGGYRVRGRAALMPRAPEVVLLVDDIRDHAVNYEAALTRHGFHVRVATSGEEALRVARETLPDCAVIDLRLPDMSGWDLCREIRKPKS